MLSLPVIKGFNLEVCTVLVRVGANSVSFTLSLLAVGLLSHLLGEWANVDSRTLFSLEHCFLHRFFLRVHLLLAPLCIRDRQRLLALTSDHADASLG